MSDATDTLEIQKERALDLPRRAKEVLVGQIIFDLD
jgi:hypothetical protein